MATPHQTGAAPVGSDGLYLWSLGLHGLVRSSHLELGRDADTGGQTAYMVDQARALASHPAFDSVDLVTRLIEDRRVDPAYAVPRELISDGARIVRIQAGPRRYLRKESLWPYLDSLADNLLRFLRASRRAPDLIHAHYADAGYVGNQLARVLAVPLIFTGHSLGRVKRARLVENGGDPEALEERYRFGPRIEAEERTLEAASLVIASTNQEVREQYELYDHYQPERMKVIPPGVNLSRFSPPSGAGSESTIREKLEPFLREPGKPAILAIARADERKNFLTLIRAYAETPELSRKANLILVTGPRKDIEELSSGARRVLRAILREVDRYDLYGSIAYPKQIAQDDIADLYRFAARTRGVLVNPALTEPFGLTLIEAAASGLPIIATSDGGPRDIIQACENGVLVDPLDAEEMGRLMLAALTSPDTWQRWSENGLSRVRQFSWTNHAERYVSLVRNALNRTVTPRHRSGRSSRLTSIDRAIVADLDGTLTGDEAALQRFETRLEQAGDRVGLIIVTGRSLETTREVFERFSVPIPDVVITGSGTEIYYGWPSPATDQSWLNHIDYQWHPNSVREVLGTIDGVRVLRVRDRLHVACRLDPYRAPPTAKIRAYLRQHGQRVTVLLDRKVHLDVLPMRASPGLALRFLSFKLDLPLERMLVAGDSGNDIDMLSGNTLGVVVANHTPALEVLRERPHVYFSGRPHADGVLDGADFYGFFDRVHIPEEESPE